MDVDALEAVLSGGPGGSARKERRCTWRYTERRCGEARRRRCRRARICWPASATRWAGRASKSAGRGYDEVTAAIALLKELPLKGAVVTGRRDVRPIVSYARPSCGVGGDYMLPLKDNQKALKRGTLKALEKKTAQPRMKKEAFVTGASRRAASKWCPWGMCSGRDSSNGGASPAPASTRSVAHSPPNRSASSPAWDHRRQDRRTGSGLQPKTLGHRDRLHWLKDTLLREVPPTIRTGSAPQALAALRNTALRHLSHPHPSPTQARETAAENKSQAIQLLGCFFK